MKSSARVLAFWVGLFLFAVYILSFSGKLHIMDEFVGFAVGNNLVQHGRPDVNQFIWTNHWHTTPPGVWGKDGNLYTKKAPGISFAAAPLIWLGHTVPDLNAVHVSLLTSAIATNASTRPLPRFSLILVFMSSTPHRSRGQRVRARAAGKNVVVHQLNLPARYCARNRPGHAHAVAGHHEQVARDRVRG